MEKRKLIHLESLALHCDACGFDIPGVGIDAKWIGHACPECGANMLTEQDYQSGVKLLRFAEWVNRWFGWLGCTPEEAEKRAAGEKVSVNPHANKLTIETIDSEGN